MVFESAKPWHEADGDVIEAVDYLRYYAAQARAAAAAACRWATCWARTTSTCTRAAASRRSSRPGTSRWRSSAGMSSAALAAGNCAILKPAAQSPLIAARLVEILREAGVPRRGRAVPARPRRRGRPGAGRAPRRRRRSPSPAAGRSGWASSRLRPQVRPGQRNVKRVIAEMGGKNAIIVDDDADLDQAVAGVVVSAFGYAGQKCSACSRLIVVGSAYDEALDAAGARGREPGRRPAARPRDLRAAGDQRSRAARRSRATSRPGRRRRDCWSQGSTRRPATATTCRPTVFADVPPRRPAGARRDLRAGAQRVPRARLRRGAGDRHATREFALTGGLFSRNPRNIERARRALPRRQPLHKPQDHRRRRRAAALRRLRDVRRRREGRRAGLPAAVPGTATVTRTRCGAASRRKIGIGTAALAADERVAAGRAGGADLDDRCDRALGAVGGLIHHGLCDHKRAAPSAVEVDRVCNPVAAT